MASAWRRRFWIWSDPPDLLTTTLGVAGPSPFYQMDWPNPRTTVQPLANQGFIRSANVQLIGLDQFFGAPGQGPCYDWPNPITLRRIPQADCQSSLLVGGLARPFYQDDWPNPRAAIQPLENLGFARAANVQLIGQDRFFGAAGQVPTYDWPNPTTRRVQQPDSLPTILVGSLAVPFAQFDWPNPRTFVQPQENKGFVRSANVQLIGQDQFYGAPGEVPVHDWPNPAQPSFRQPDIATNLLPLTVIVAAPFFQVDWPNPAQRRLVQADCQSSILVGLLARPFFQSDWPNPTIRRVQQPDNVSTILVGLLAVPFTQTDWPNPAQSRFRQPDLVPNILPLTVVAAAPFFQTDWPNPFVRVQDYGGFVHSAFVSSIVPPPFNGASAIQLTWSVTTVNLNWS